MTRKDFTDGLKLSKKRDADEMMEYINFFINNYPVLADVSGNTPFFKTKEWVSLKTLNLNLLTRDKDINLITYGFNKLVERVNEFVEFDNK